MDWIYRKKRNRLSILNFHDDILVKIFTRLSISTILSCRCVCKSWCIFLSSHHFAKSYQSNPPFTSIIIQSGKLFALLELKSGDYNYSLKSSKPKILPDPFGLSYCGYETRSLVGSCNGFFCYSDKDVLYVSNPLSGTGRTHVRLPEKVLDGVSNSSYGFGFCPQTRHYKVIELATYVVPRKKTRTTEVHVFTVGIDESWRRIHSPFQYIEQRLDKQCPIIQFLEVNGKGALHWIVDGSDRLDYLYSFDINEEKVRPIPPPLGLNKRNESTLLLCMNGCLCLLHIHNIEDEMVEFWCMTDYMVQGSWSVRFVSQTSFPRGTLRFENFLPVAVWKNEEILMIDQGNYIVSCDLEQKNFNMLDIALARSYLDHAAAYFVPNFNSYDLETGTTETEAKDDDARKLGLLSQKNSKPTEVANGDARIMDNILSRVFIRCREFQEKFLSEKLLSRVPMVDRILCCKGVGKVWCRFLPNPDYKLNNTVHLILCDKASLRFLSELKSDLFNNVKVCRILATTTTPSMAKITVLGSCNGLVCLSVFSDHHPDHQTLAHNICICNPVLQEVAILPQPQGVERIRDEAYGFGFSSTTGHYKVLRLLTRKWRPGQFEAYVLTIGIDKNWREVVGGGTFRMPKKWPDNINKSRFCDVPFNNAIHWIAEGDSKLIIYAFDIDEERFNSLSLLPGIYNMKYKYRYPCLGILRDRLCLCVLHIAIPSMMELWTMTSYGLVTSWTRQRVWIPHISIPILTRRVFLPVTSWRDDEILVWVEDGGGTLFSYCLKHKTSVEIKIDGIAANNNQPLIAVPYVQTFLSLGDAFQNGNLEVNKMIIQTTALQD